MMDHCICSPILPPEMVQSLVAAFLVMLMMAGFFLGIFYVVDRISKADRRKQSDL